VHLHAHFARVSALDALRLGKLVGATTSVIAHGWDVYRDPRNLRAKLAGADFAAGPCAYTVRDLRAIAGREVETIVMGVDGDAFQRTAPHPGGRHVAAVGRLVEKKGFVHLVRAAARLDGVRVTIMGEGPLREALTAEIARLDVGDRVTLAGAGSPEDVRALLERADLLAMPCVVAADGDRDAMPVVVKEALAMEVPVVASDEVGLPEVVRPEWGRLVPPGEPVALARAINELVTLPRDRRAQMGRAGREFVLEHCSLSGESRRLAALIAAAQSNSDRLRTLP